MLLRPGPLFDVAPFRRLSDDYFALACSLLLTVQFVCAIFYKYGALTDTAELQV